MNTKTILFVLLSALFLSCQTKDKEHTGESASQTIFYGGDIITMQGDTPQYVEAVVSEGEKIMFAGKKDEAFSRYPDATPYNLNGNTMLPGFIDPHSHFMSAIRMVDQVNVAAPPVGDATDIPTIMKKLVDFKKQRNLGDDGWIVGWGYDQDLIREKRHITKTDIDE